jgi:hypothetical protein
MGAVLLLALAAFDTSSPNARSFSARLFNKIPRVFQDSASHIWIKRANPGGVPL